MDMLNDALAGGWLHNFQRLFAGLFGALLLTACSGSGSPETIPGPITHWPPDEPGKPERLATPLPEGADPLAWWKSTFFDPLPSSIYSDGYTAKVAAALIKETNERRADNGVQPVLEDNLLDRVAQAHAIDEATRDYWNHRNPEGMGSHARVLAASGITVTAGGENSAVADVLGSHTASQVIRSFEFHPGHRELLLNPDVQRIGIGVYQYAPDEQVHIIQLLMAY